MADSPIKRDFDVVIAGAGIAGATLALALESGGLKVALIDPQTFDAQLEPRFDGRASAISYAAFRQWRTLGLAPLLEPYAQPIIRILVTDGRSPGASTRAPNPAWLHFDALEIAETAGGEPLGYMLENRHIRKSLVQALSVRPITVLSPAQVTSFDQGEAGVSVRLLDGRALDASLLVGADGRRSLVREQSGVGVQGWEYSQAAIVATVALTGDHGGVAYEHFLPTGPFAILPLTARRASLVWTEGTRRAASLMGASDTLFAAHLARRFGEFVGRIEVEGPRFCYPLSLQLADRLTAARVALIGEAAHAVHPIAGQGLNMGLKDAAALAQVVTDAARLGEDFGRADVLERYSRWRRLDNIGVAVATDAFTRLFSTDNMVVRLARDVGIAMVNSIGPTRRWLMAEAGGSVGDLPRLLRGQAL